MQLDVFPPFSRATGSALQCVLNALTPRPALDKPRNSPLHVGIHKQAGFSETTRKRRRLCPRDKAAVVIVVIAVLAGGGESRDPANRGLRCNSVNLGLTVNRGWG